MPAVMVRYTLKPGHAERNEALVRAVYRELHDTQPSGFRYATFKLDDGLTFIHVAAHEGESPLRELKAFAEFQAAIRERCDEEPIVTQAEEIGSYPRPA